jgi:hypothetical protein
MKTCILVVGLIVSQMLCSAQDKPSQSEKRIWGRSYSLHSLPDGKDTRLEVGDISQGPEHLVGVFDLTRQRQGRGRQLVIQGHLNKRGEFTANVSLEVGNQEDGGNWTSIESSFSNEVDVTLTAAPHIEALFIRVQLDAFQPYIGKFKFGRIVLQTGESTVVPLVWLTEKGE